MKVLFINHVPLTGTGSGVYTTNLANSLTKKGNDAAIIFPENRRKYELYENIKLYPVFFKNKDIIETENQLDMNFPCFTTHPRSTFNFRDMTQQQRKDYEEVFFKKINEVINEFKPDIVHAQHVWTLSGVAAECCKTRQIPMVITCHGTDLMAIDDEQKRNENWGTNWAIKAVEYAKAIITISKDSNILLESMLPETKGKTIKIRNGVNSNIFFIDKSINKKEVLKSLGVEKEYNKVVCFAGKLAEFKGVDVLLDAAKKYETNDIVTLISGDGKLREDLKEQANRLNLKNVKFLGNQPQDKLREIYNIADCSCVPSRREPFGLVAIEAISCGTPVVATNEGGLPDFITPDVGILIPVDDANKLADAIISILDSKVKFDGEKIAKKIKENYSQDVLIDKFIEIYKK